MKQHFSRNLGLISQEQQQAISDAKLVVCGTGGMGGVAAEALVRMGVGQITIVDHDRYELTNLNRQLHATEASVGLLKVEVVADKLRAINSDLQVRCYRELTKDNVHEIVLDADYIINGMDDVRASIILEREAHRLAKTIVDAWITPYASVFVMRPGSPHWEEFLNFPTLGKSVDAISDEDVRQCLMREAQFTLAQFHPFDIVSPDTVQKILNREIPRPSLLPVVWLSGTLMANEVMKLITGQGRIASHWGVFYNQYDHEMKLIDGKDASYDRAKHFKIAS